MNELKVFKNPMFGNMEVLLVDGKEHFPATECAKMLGYANPQEAIRTHCKGVSRILTPTAGGKQQKNYVALGDLSRLIAHSQLPAAQKFESWVFDDIVPSVIKTGSYTAPGVDEKKQRAEAMLMNARTRQANLMLKMANDERLGTQVVELLKTNAVEVLSGRPIVYRPSLPEPRYYSATEIGDQCGRSAQAVGHAAIQNNMKTPEYGMWILDKSRHSTKQVQTFIYNEQGRLKLLALLGEKTA